MRLKVPSVDSKVGARIFRMMPYGLYVVTTRDERGPHGMTASWVIQVSHKPPMVAVAVDRRHTTCEMIRKTMVFAVNFLPKGRADIAERFFTPYQRLGRAAPFADYAFGRTGSPLLKEAIAVLDCRATHVYEPGDHVVFVGNVVGAELRSDEAPLALADTDWHYNH